MSLTKPARAVAHIIEAPRSRRWRCRETGGTARILGVLEGYVVWRFLGAAPHAMPIYEFSARFEMIAPPAVGRIA